MIIEIEEDNRFDKGDTPPQAGGCWFCHRKQPGEDLCFDTEYDTYYHRKCLEKTGFNSVKEYEEKGP